MEIPQGSLSTKLFTTSPAAHTILGHSPSSLFPLDTTLGAAGRSQPFGCPACWAHPCDNQTCLLPGGQSGASPPQAAPSAHSGPSSYLQPPPNVLFLPQGLNKGRGRPVSCPPSLFLPLAAEKRDSAVPTACEKLPPALCFMKENLLGRAAKRSQPPAGCLRRECCRM